MTTDLSKRQRRLAELTDTIQRGLATFVEVGRALLEVRQDRLWSDGWESFDAWCLDVHGFGQTYASRLITASTTPEDLPDGQKPQSERQARKQRSESREQADESPAEAASVEGQDTAEEQPAEEREPAAAPLQDRIVWVIEELDRVWDDYVSQFEDRAERYAFVAGLENWKVRSE